MLGTKKLTFVWLMFAGFCVTAQSQALPPDNRPFQVCHDEYALCTFSECGRVQVLGAEATTMCTCRIQNDFSVGKECAGPTKLGNGQTQVMSRYHPITTYSRCTNSRQWAMCLDSPCTIDPTNPADKNKPQQAQCKCSVVSGQGDWLVQPETDQCTSGLISSATVVDLDQITDYLETHRELHIPNFTVVNVSPK
jgi:hypothetical protein